jgi:hypothetical protein
LLQEIQLPHASLKKAARIVTKDVRMWRYALLAGTYARRIAEED